MHLQRAGDAEILAERRPVNGPLSARSNKVFLRVFRDALQALFARNVAAFRIESAVYLQTKVAPRV